MDGEFDILISTYIDGTQQTYDFGKITVSKNTNVVTFEIFGFQHMMGIVLAIVIGIIIMLFWKKKSTENTAKTLYTIVAMVLMYCDIAVRVFLSLTGNFKASYHFALHMCDISSVVIVYALLLDRNKLSKTMYNLAFFWGFGGASMALLTPDMLGYSFPNYFYFNFFFKHGLLVIALFMLTYIGKNRPAYKYFLKVMGITALSAIVLYGVNQLMIFLPPYEIGNYMFLSYPPLGGSPIDMLVDIFGPSPYYIIGLTLLASVIYLALIFVFTIPSYIKRDH